MKRPSNGSSMMPPWHTKPGPEPQQPGEQAAPAHPLWREEFSVHIAEDKYVQRRQFTKFLTLTSAGMFAGNIWIFLRSLWDRPHAQFPQAVIARASQLGIGAVKLFRYPTEKDPCILVRAADGKLAAYSQKCTHLSCAVYYSHANNRLECPCHEGYFAVDTGRVLQGPPPRPLPKIAIEQRGDDIVAIGVHYEGAV
ncbi:MAG TPA: ubiquinol-cytochrome c reductase iron-sulfur subunit [Bryobacteraceae bacterium]|nr:ubiquinol-cytochrome c reductase iron-sulfur subunit [Bryobacteraceae bacterium]